MFISGIGIGVALCAALIAVQIRQIQHLCSVAEYVRGQLQSTLTRQKWYSLEEVHGASGCANGVLLEQVVGILVADGGLVARRRDIAEDGPISPCEVDLGHFAFVAGMFEYQLGEEKHGGKRAHTPPTIRARANGPQASPWAPEVRV